MNKDNGKIKIVILQCGWIMIGNFYQEDTRCELHNSYTIRRWGTTKGLGQLAKDGATDETILDANNLPVDFHELTIIASLLCDEEAWREHFKVDSANANY